MFPIESGCAYDEPLAVERVGNGMVAVTLKTAKTGEIVQFALTSITLVQMVNQATDLMNSNLSGFLTVIGMI